MRLFVAVEPSPGFRAALSDVKEKLREAGVTGKYREDAGLHLTLAFIGEWPDAAGVLEVLPAVREPFSVTLSHPGIFPGANVLWAGIEPSEELEQLAAFLNKYALIYHFVLAFVLYFLIEAMSRHSLAEAAVFMVTHKKVYLYNTLMIYLSLTLVFLTRRRSFARIFISFIWFLMGAVNGLGAQAVAAVSAASKVHNVVAAPLETCGIAMATYCGQNLGAGQYARIRRGIWSTTAAAMIYCALAFVFNYSAGRSMATLFVSPSEVMILQDVQKYLVIQSVFYPMLAVIFIFRNGLQGMGYSNQAMMAGVSELIARALVSFGLVSSLGFTAVCYANPVAWLFADGVLLILYARVMRRLDPIRPQDLKARKLAKAQR